MRRITSTGNTLTEYGFLIGLVALASVTGLKFLGGSTSDLLTDFSDSPGVMKMMSMDFKSGANSSSSSPVSLRGSGYYTQVRNARTGKMEFRMTNSNNSVATNSTSIDGDQWNSLGQIRIGDTLWQLAEKQTDPAAKAFIQNLAETSYYMGAAEGEIDAVKQFQLHDPAAADYQYGKINGYADIKRLQKTIMSTLNNPPSGLDAQTLQQVNALSLDVYNIGQTYVNALKGVNTNAEYSFTLPLDTSIGAGNGTPGQSLSVVPDQITYCTNNDCGRPQSKGGPKVEDVFTVNELRTLSKEVLGTFGVASEPVVVTLQDATHLEHKATVKQ